MDKYYRKKDRLVWVKVWLTADQVAVLMNHALYRVGSIDVEKEVQFAIDWVCHGEGAYAEAASELQEQGDRPLPFDASLLPDPQDLQRDKEREKQRKKARKEFRRSRSGP